nr:unnamed protein product [Callosobruchus analis]
MQSVWFHFLLQICSDDFNVHVITGPNGSGKSIFIRQVMLLQVMAQVGCYVPAQTATFKPADFMFARIYLDDNMEYGASSFVLELCRSTSVEEGTALAIAIVEKLLQSSAFIYITTHFVLLTKLYDMYPNVKMSFKLHYKYSLLPGVTSVRQYGVYIVRNIWPDYVIKWVDEILEKISETPKEFRMTTLDPKCRLKYTIESEFRRLKQKQQLTVSEINKLLIQYQNDLSKLGYNINIQPFNDRNLQQTQSLELDEDFSTGMYVGENNAQQENQEMALQTNFTPEPSEQSQEANLSHTKWEEVFTPEPSLDGNPQDPQYGLMSRFIAEDPQNIYKLMPEISIYENQENLFPNISPEGTMADDSCLRTLMGSTSTPIVQRYDGARNFPASTRLEDTVDEIESIKEDLEICSQILNDEDDFCELEQSLKPNAYDNLNENTFQATERHQTPPESTFQMSATLTETHKQCNNIPDLDDYENFADHISTVNTGRHKELTEAPTDEYQKDGEAEEEIKAGHVLGESIKKSDKVQKSESAKTNPQTCSSQSTLPPLPVDYYQKDVDQQNEEIEEGHMFAESFKTSHTTQSSQRANMKESTDDIIPQPINSQFNLPTETRLQKTESRPTSNPVIVYENKESQNPKDIEPEETTKTMPITKSAKIEDSLTLSKKEQEDGLGMKNTHITEENIERKELQESKQRQHDHEREKSENINKHSTFAKPNTYKYYYSPVTVNIIEGPNVKTLSIDEDDSILEEVYGVQPAGRIDVLEHIVFTPKGTIISALNKTQELKMKQNIEEDHTNNKFNVNNQEGDVNATANKQEIDEVGCDEDGNEQKNNDIILSPKESRQEPNESYNDTKIDNPTAGAVVTDSETNEFKSSDSEKKDKMGMGKTLTKLIEHLDQSVVSFKSIAEETSEYESAHDESTFKFCIPIQTKPTEKTFSRFFSCDDTGIDKQMTCVGDFERHDTPMNNSYAKVDADIEKNDKLREENVKMDEEDACTVSDVQKQSTAGISYASKLRNLDSPTDEKSNETKKRSSPATSISSASKKRNLDQATTNTSSSTTPSKFSGEHRESEVAASESSFDIVTKRKKMAKRKFVSPRDAGDQSKTESSSDSKPIKPRQKALKKFKPPRKLTAKEIREEFERQDQKLIEFTHTSTNSSDVSKYLERRMNRPTVKGPEVIPAEATTYKKRRSLIRRNFSNENIDLSIFSDKNAECFEKFLGSNETNYSTFKFNFQESKKTESVFKFDPIETKSGEYTERSVTMAFMRRASDEATEITQNSRPMFTPFKASFNPHNQTLTPDGYFKRNKTEITNLLSKYRQQDSLQDSAAGGQNRNIFESSDSIHCDDLNL